MRARAHMTPEVETIFGAVDRVYVHAGQTLTAFLICADGRDVRVVLRVDKDGTPTLTVDGEAHDV